MERSKLDDIKEALEFDATLVDMELDAVKQAYLDYWDLPEWQYSDAYEADLEDRNKYWLKQAELVANALTAIEALLK